MELRARRRALEERLRLQLGGARRAGTQAWRGPLREALDWLRDDARAALREPRPASCFRDPWEARDDYIGVILGPVAGHACAASWPRRPAGSSRRRTGRAALKLLELQRHAHAHVHELRLVLRRASAGIETRQILQYAGRALQLAGELFGAGLEERFLGLLEKAKSNSPEVGDGKRIYEESVRPAMVSLEKVGAHYGVSSLFSDYGESARVYCYGVRREDYRLVASGRARLALGRARVLSEITGESEDIAFGVLHLGDHNLSGGTIAFPGKARYEKLVAEISEPFRKADLTETLRTVDRSFGSGVYTLRLLFRDEQQQVLGLILSSVLDAADAVYRDLYEEHAPLMRFLSSHGIAQPRGFRMAAELALNRSLRQALEAAAPDPARLSAVLEEARNVGITLHEDGLGLAVEHTLERLADGLRGKPSDLARLEELEAVVDLGRQLPFEVDFWKVQNAYYGLLRSLLPGRQREAEAGFEDARRWVERFLALGEKLSVKVAEGEPPKPAADI